MISRPLGETADWPGCPDIIYANGPTRTQLETTKHDDHTRACAHAHSKMHHRNAALGPFGTHVGTQDAPLMVRLPLAVAARNC